MIVKQRVRSDSEKAIFIEDIDRGGGSREDDMENVDRKGSDRKGSCAGKDSSQ